MTWSLSAAVSLRNDRVPDLDADRQERTAREILERLNEQPGVVLADEVGMGKTYVALAVAVSVIESTKRRRPVVIMVPPSVAEKWPAEWAVFEERCLPPNFGIRASDPVRRGSEFLKLLDDPAEVRKHLIIITHGALSTNLNDPFIRLALIRRAMLRRPDLEKRKRPIARYAAQLLGARGFEEQIALALLEAPTSQWLSIWNRRRPHHALEDDPVPDSFEPALAGVDLEPLRDAIRLIPMQSSSTLRQRLRQARAELGRAVNGAWMSALRALDEHLPLVILDEAHHVKNPNQLAKLFDNREAEQDIEALQGPLGNMFERMLFLTATPFQLGHHELIGVLDRFHGIRWSSASARRRFDSQVADLKAALDASQAAALRFERAWSRIDVEAAAAVDGLEGFEVPGQAADALTEALAIGADAERKLRDAEQLLRPWVIRHVKPHRELRRRYLSGAAITNEADAQRGLTVTGRATLPFLLAARAQALASLHGEDSSSRAYFAYGLASSFEAYADTRRNRDALDEDAQSAAVTDGLPSRVQWYLDRISQALPRDTAEGWAGHPKIAATVERVRQLWRDGEKCLVFCFYVETGRALRSHISRALREEILTMGAKAFAMNPSDEDDILAEFERASERLLRADAPGYGRFRKQVRALAGNLDEPTQDRVAEIVIRFMRTPSFLVRYLDLSRRATTADLLAGLERPDLSGRTLAERIREFAVTLQRKVETERTELFEALEGIQTGTIASAATFDPSEFSSEREMLMPNVRLANGGVKRETRRRLMLTFNSPFFPEVLVASAVMSEGVDLQHDCRHVIHHDLDWNPSTLEQRTGRLDRIGSKAEVCGEPVVVYEPYLSGTHDEKMFSVVKDRERWFGVVMGDGGILGERESESLARRIPLPAALSSRLTLDLSL